MEKEFSLIISNPNNGEFLKAIRWNKEEFIQVVKAITEQYKGLVYTENDMKAAKADRARLNAMKKEISDKRIEVKNAVMAPYAQFEKEVKEVTAYIDEPLLMIDGQIKQYEETKKAEKRAKLEEYFHSVAHDLPFLTFDKVFDQRYLNISFSLSKAEDEILESVKQVQEDLRTIAAFASEEYVDVAREFYSRTFDLSGALAEAKRIEDINQKLDEKRRREAEQAAAELEAAKSSSCKSQDSAAEAPDIEKTEAGKQSEPPSAEEGHTEEHQAPQGDTKQYKASFTIYGTKEQIMAVKQFMIEKNIKFGKVER